MGFKYMLDKIRKNYESSPRKDFSLRHPIWIYTTQLRYIYTDKKYLATNGKIVYAHLLQANSLIFKKRLLGPDLPGVLLYSMEPYYDEHPEELGELAKEIYKYKNKNDAPREIKKFVALITNERTYELNLELPMSLTPNGKVYYTTFMIWRKHLIDKYLKATIFPILVDPDNVKSCMIVPKEYWPAEYIYYYDFRILPLKTE